MYIKKRYVFMIIKILIFIIIFNMTVVRVYADDEALKEAKEAIQNYYIDKVPEEALKATTMEEMIDSLKDPYTQYFTDKEFQNFITNMNMSFIGIGIYIEMVTDGAKVTSVLINTPAKEAGIQDGDIILMINNKLVSELEKSQVLTLMNGDEGTEVNLKVLREGKVTDYSIAPRKIPYATVIGEIIDNEIGYIRIASFGSVTSSEFYNRIDELNRQNVSGYIVDLRNNLGGYIYEAVEISSYFIGKNVSMIVEDKKGDRYKIRPTEDKHIADKPVVFLINDYTASAAELLVAAVKDYHNVILIGTNTYGKGVGQNVFHLSDGSYLKTTTLRFYSPKGKDINYTGIEPDIWINNIDPLLAAEILIGNRVEEVNLSRCVSIRIFDKEYIINLEKLKTKDYWEAYRHIIGRASSIDTMNDNIVSVMGKYVNGIAPQLKFAEMPKTNYKIGDRVTFKLSTPNYDNRVQYRAILWEENSNTYYDLWNSGDKYYSQWKPRGSDVFEIGFPITRQGDYRIKFFVKCVGVLNKNTLIKGMNCDSYMEEVPFIVTGA